MDLNRDTASHKLIWSLGHYTLNGEYQVTFPAALGLAGLELAFFIAAHRELCFGCVTKTVLVTLMLWLQLDSAGTVKVAFPPPPSRQGMGKRPGGDTATPKLTKGTSQPIWHPAQQQELAERKKRKGGHLW